LLHGAGHARHLEPQVALLVERAATLDPKCRRGAEVRIGVGLLHARIGRRAEGTGYWLRGVLDDARRLRGLVARRIAQADPDRVRPLAQVAGTDCGGALG